MKVEILGATIRVSKVTEMPTPESGKMFSRPEHTSNGRTALSVSHCQWHSQRQLAIADRPGRSIDLTGVPEEL